MKKALTLKQQKLIKGISENVGKKGKTKPLGKIMLEAGYSKSRSETPAAVLESPAVQTALSPFIKALARKRERALVHLTEIKLRRSNGLHLAHIADILTKNHQLLTGGDTEKLGIDTYAINLDDLRKKLLK